MKAPTHLMDQTISVTRSTATVDAGGFPITTYTAHLSSVKARVVPVSGSENVRSGRPATMQTFSVYVSGGQDITAADRITWGSSTLRIIEPPVDFGSQGVLEKLVAAEVTP